MFETRRYATLLRMRPREADPAFQTGSKRRGPLQPPRLLAISVAASGQNRIMSTSDPKRIGVSIELKPHAYDPVTQPELFEGVLARRVVAFLIDFLIISVPVV